jgi:hypothetical protein
MSFRQMGIERQRSLAVIFGLLEPSSLGREFEVQNHRYMGKRGVRKGKLRIALDGV